MNLDSNKLHFWLNFKGKRISYVYIRKNGCSSWKRFFTNESPYSKFAKDFSNPINFMAKYHKVKSLEELQAIDEKIVVLRDPVERLYSGFINQYIMRLNKSRHGVMHEEVSGFLNRSPEKITFNIFLNDYVFKSGGKLNVHFMHQFKHLADIEYNEKWKLEELYSKSEVLFGKDIAEKYFKKKRNSTDKIEKIDGDFKDVRLDKIFEIYNAESKLPSINSFIGEEEREALQSFYVDDFLLINNI